MLDFNGRPEFSQVLVTAVQMQRLIAETVVVSLEVANFWHFLVFHGISISDLSFSVYFLVAAIAGDDFFLPSAHLCEAESGDLAVPISQLGPGCPAQGRCI